MREESTVLDQKVERKVGEIWKHRSKWLVKGPNGILGFGTKKRAEAWARASTPKD